MKRLIFAMASLGLALAIVALASGRRADANDIAPFQTFFATDVASAGFGGMRGLGTGTITLSGVSGTVTKAFFYWQGPTNSSDPTGNASVTFAGNNITGTNIGFSNDNCWGFANSQAYRADVTSLVAGDGNYSLSGFVGTDNNGNAVDINGVSLMVFFDDGDNTNNRDVVVFDGNDSNISNAFDADGWNVSLAGIDYDSGTVKMELHVSDGQTFTDDALILNAVTLEPGPQIFDGNTVPNGPGGPSNGGLWDIRSFDVTSFLNPGPNTLTLTTGVAGDCLSLVVAAIDLPTGAAPDQPTPPGRLPPHPTATPCGTAGCPEPTPTPTDMPTPPGRQPPHPTATPCGAAGCPEPTPTPTPIIIRRRR